MEWRSRDSRRYPNGNWEAMIGQLEGIYNSMVNANTLMKLIKMLLIKFLMMLLSLWIQTSNANQGRHFFIEDNIWSFWQGAGTYHNAHNVARDWISTEDLIQLKWRISNFFRHV